MSFHLNNITIENILPMIQEVASQYLTRENSRNITVKGDSNFVTEVDMQIEKAMKERLLSLYPDTQFMGEEKDNSDVDFTTPVWILDPVDGTSNLIHDFQNSSMSLALAIDKKIVFGIIYHYSTKEYFWAKKGQGAYVGTTPINVSDTTELSRSLVSFGTSPYDKATLGEKNCQTLKQIFFTCEDIRRIGSAAIELAYVAAGRVDIYLERNLKPWDFAAAIIIIEEAGGIITDYNGQAIDISKPSDILAGNKMIHEKLRHTIPL
ncbi:MAG: inositol monophosphatase [Lachnospiraceae bacterium]|nr:inositol monophosphatase [Lachnospiraceae bacterium]